MKKIEEIIFIHFQDDQRMSFGHDLFCSNSFQIRLYPFFKQNEIKANQKKKKRKKSNPVPV